MLGREEEIAVIAKGLERADAGCRAILLEGGAGIGKTTVWRQAVELAHARGMRVLSCAPAEQERELGFAALGDLLDGNLAEVTAALPAPQARALEVALLLRDPGADGPEPPAIAAGVLGGLRALSSERPTVLAVDDVQWLDGATEAALAYAVRRLDGAPVLLLLARRADRPREPPLGLGRAVPEDRLLRVWLPPLGADAVHQLLHSRLGLALPRPTLLRIHEAAGGNPFYALELGRGLQRAGRVAFDGEPLPVPDTLRELVDERMRAVPPRTRHALALAAALRAPVVGLVGDALGEPDPWDLLRPAVDAEVIRLDGERIRFTHPLLAQAVYAATDLAGRRELHARLAEVTADVESRALHRALATPSVDTEVAAELDRAAAHALARAAPATAAELLRHARRLTPAGDSAAAARRTIEAAQALVQAGAADMGNRLAGTVIDDDRAPPPLRTEARLVVMEWDLRPDLVEPALADAGDDLALRARVLRADASIMLFEGDLRGAIARAADAADTARRSGDQSAELDSLAVLGSLSAIGGTADADAHLRRAVALERRERPSSLYWTGSAWLALRAMWADDLEPARSCLAGLLSRASDEGDDGSRSQLLFHLAELEVRAGDFALARAHAQACLDLTLQSGVELDTVSSMFVVAMADAHLGRIDPARAAARTGLADAERLGDRLFPPQHRTVLGFVATSCGDHPAALAEVGELAVTLDRIGIGEPGIYLFVADELEALAQTGELARLEERLAVVGAEAERLDRSRGRAYACRGRGFLLAAQGDLTGAIEAVESALGHHDRLPVPFERARTLLALGTLQRRVKRRKAARESLQEAQAAFGRLCSPLWAAKARRELERIGGRAPAGEGLTPTERRVAALVAEGRSNKEVAAELFVAVGTVEANLTSVYAKLGVRSRTELARRFPG